MCYLGRASIGYLAQTEKAKEMFMSSNRISFARMAYVQYAEEVYLGVH